MREDKSKERVIVEEVAAEVATDLFKGFFRWLADLFGGRDREFEEKVRATLPTEEFCFATQADEEIRA